MLCTEQGPVLQSCKRSVIPSPRAAKKKVGVVLMELLLALAAGAAGLALLVQAKTLPSESDFKKAKEKLDSNPVDPDANTTVGKYTAFVLGDYSAAMPFLVHSGDKTLRTLAEHELDETAVDTPAKKVGMGDEWVTGAKNFKPLYRMFYDRATQWYAAAWPGLDNVWKEKVRERFKKMLLLPAQTAVKTGLPAGWTALLPNPKVAVDGSIAHNGGKSFRIETLRDKPTESFWVQGPMMVVPKGQATYSVWMATDGTDGAQDRVGLNFYSADGALIAKSQGFIPVDSPFWQRVEVKTEIPKEAVRFRVVMEIGSGKGTIWADDFSLRGADGKEYVDNGSFEK